MMTSPHPVIGEGSIAYRGIKSVVAKLLRIPLEPASIPVNSGELLESFHPAPGWIRLRQVQTVVGASMLILVNVIFAVGGWFLNQDADWIGWLILIPFVVIPSLIRLLFLRLQYDCTWYVLTARALRIRRGLWVIHETTITYANIQNVAVKQGPIERLFKLSNIEVETAGGGGGSSESHGGGRGSSHTGRIEGVLDPTTLRERIMTQVRLSRSSGLGDDPLEGPSTPTSPAQERGEWARMAEVLREIRDQMQHSGA